MSVEATPLDPRKFFVRFEEFPGNPKVSPTAGTLEGLHDTEQGEEVKSCAVPLPSPARAAGAWTVQCQECGSSLVCLAAGLEGDPSSVSLPCVKLG